jgi:hypothetical protein
MSAYQHCVTAAGTKKWADWVYSTAGSLDTPAPRMIAQALKLFAAHHNLPAPPDRLGRKKSRRRRTTPATR